MELTHALFADDIVIFVRARKKVAREIVNCLKTYCEWSGQKVNVEKSSVYFSKNIPCSKTLAINKILGYKRLRENMVHIGLPIFKSRRLIKD